ncbi:hypothetical protein Tco_0555737 [Tanacetum coccineum]
MAFDLRPREDVLLWPGNANVAFDLWPTEDVLSWPGNANMAFDLRPTEDVLPWRVIIEYLVKISKKACILELKQRYLNIIVLKPNTSYPSRKIRRIYGCTSQKTTKETRSIYRIQGRPIRHIQDMEINILEDIERGPYSKKPPIRHIEDF